MDENSNSFRFNYRLLTLIASVLLSVCVLANANETYYSTTVLYSGAYNTSESSLSKSELKIELDAEWEFEHSTLFFSSNIATDLGGQLEVGDPYVGEPAAAGHRIPLLGSNNVLFDLREFYLRTDFLDHQLTIGKQQIAWGQADGVAVLDIVNPIRYREFVLEALEDARIPLWSIRYDLIFDNFAAQFVWVLDQSYSEIPNTVSEFSFTSPRFRPLYPAPFPAVYDIKPIDKPNSVIKDSDFGFEISSQIMGWDLSVNYFNHVADAPVFYRDINRNTATPIVTVRQTFERNKTYGFGVNNNFGQYVFRAEFAYHTDRYSIDYNPFDLDGAFVSPEINYVLGLDYYGFDSSLVSVQFYQSRLQNYTQSLPRERNDTIVTFLYRVDLMNENLNLETQWFYDTKNNDGLARASANYRVTDDIGLALYIDTFYGDPTGVFGQFSSNDRIGFTVKANF